MGKWLDRARQNVGPPSGKRQPQLTSPDERRQWDAEDWRAFFDECAAITEHDGGQPRREAERIALEHCVSRWLAANQPTSDTGDACIHCGVEAQQTNATALATGFGVRVHFRCHAAFQATRRALAIAALAQVGLGNRQADLTSDSDR